MILNKKTKIGVIVLLYVIGCFFQNDVYLMILYSGLILSCGYVILTSIFEIKIFISYILLYLLCYCKYLFYGKKLSVYTEFYKPEYLYKTGLLMFLFVSILVVSLGKIKINKLKFNIGVKKINIYLIMLNLGIILYFMVSGVNGKIGDYTKISLSSKVEYLILPYIMVVFFSPTKILKLINGIFYCYIMYLFLLGSRITGIQLLFMILVLNKNLIKRYRNNKGLIIILLCIIAMDFVGDVRSLPGNIYEKIQFYLMSESSNRIVNNEADVIYSGTALIGLIKIGILNLEMSVKTFIFMLFDLFGINIFNQNLSIPWQIINFTPIGGGGLISSQLYYLGREPLVILIAYFIGNNVKKLFGTIKNNLYTLYRLMILLTVFRWFAYSLNTLYKMSCYAILVYYINMMLDKFIKKRKEKNG